MLHITKQYRQLFFAFISSNFNNAPDSSISFKDELSKNLDDKELSLDEARSLLTRLEAGEKLRYTKDSAKTLVDSLWVDWTDTWINSKSFKEKLISIIESADNEREEIIDESKKWLKKEKIRLNQDQETFKNIDKTIWGLDKANKLQIMAYQSFLVWVWYDLWKSWPNNDWVDWISWKKTKDAYNEYKAWLEKVNFKWWKVKYWKEANNVINELIVVDKYLEAFNKSYGWKWETLSKDNGIIMQLARVFDITDNNVERLYSQLESDEEFKEILNELNWKLDKKAFWKELWLDDNSNKFDSWVKRTLIIALVSLIISKWSWIALELWAINYWENLHKWPKIEEILKTFGINIDKENVMKKTNISNETKEWNIDMKEELRKMYLSPSTTLEWLKRIIDILNNSNMEPANLRRFIKNIYQPNWIQNTFWIFLPDWYDRLDELIEQFEKTSNTKDALAIVKEIYRLSYKAYKKLEKEKQEQFPRQLWVYTNYEWKTKSINLEKNTNPWVNWEEDEITYTIEFDKSKPFWHNDIKKEFDHIPSDKEIQDTIKVLSKEVELFNSKNIEKQEKFPRELWTYTNYEWKIKPINLEKNTNPWVNWEEDEITYTIEFDKSKPFWFNDIKKEFDHMPSDKEIQDTIKVLSKEVEQYNSSTDENKALRWLSWIWNITQRHSNLDAKRAKIEWEKFDIKKARKIEWEIDNQIGINIKDLKKINTKELYSKQSFSKGIDINKVNDKKYMEDIYNSMKESTINWKTSVLAWVIRWMRQHYWTTFSPEEFKKAFINTAEPTTSEYILSNIGRDKNQKLQWDIWEWNLFKITINWTKYYFKDICTNIVTVVAGFVTTVETTNSVPLIVYAKTGLDNAWENGWNNPNNSDWNPNSRPGVTDKVDIPLWTEENVPVTNNWTLL